MTRLYTSHSHAPLHHRLRRAPHAIGAIVIMTALKAVSATLSLASRIIDGREPALD